MSTLLTILGIFILMALLASPVIFLQVRKIFREQKSFERGLKMVPLLIHLPPPSDDTEVGQRDVREIVDENISKAQVLYNIISSTLKKDFKSSFYGERHFSLEIVGIKGFVYLYASVPIVLMDVIKQAVVSAYPAARVEEVEEHNIFSPVGKIGGTAGGELTLKEPFAYPIATYQELKRDAMQSMLNSLADLDKEDGVGIQILLRPAHPSWRKEANDLAESKRKGKSKKEGFDWLAHWTKELFAAFVRPPESRDESSDKPDISGIDQSVVDAMNEKTRFSGYETLIRVVASSNNAARAQTVMNNVVAAFALFDAQGKNGFTFTPAKDMERFITSYIMRFFPQEINKNILNSVELASIFHFPDQRNIPTSQLERQQSKQVDGPRNVPPEGMLLGYNVFRGAKKPIRLSLGDRQRHMYVVGQTGTGKSTFLENLALQDMLSGEGFAFVDPHGDTAERLMAMVPRERTEDVIYFCPAEMDYPMGLNLFEYDNPDQKDFLIQETINMLYKLYDPQRQGIIGPRYEDIFRNAALAVMSDPKGGTFIEIPQLFRDPDFLKQKLSHVDPVRYKTVLDYWQKQYPASQRSNDAGEVTAWFVSKFGAFLSNDMMRNIIGQTKSAFNLRHIMDNKKILLVNLSKGKTGDLNSKLLGMIFVMKFQAAAMSRANIPEDDRQDFCLYVDEFQNFSTDSFATIMSEARKYHLNLIVANQFTTQLSEEIRDAVFGNIGTIVSFRVGQNDVDALTGYFQPLFDAEDLVRVPNYNTITRTLINGVPTQPFSMATLPPLGSPNPQLADALKQLSAAKYGRPRNKVESEVYEGFKTENTASGKSGSQLTPGDSKAVSKTAGGLPGSATSAKSASPAKPAAKSGGSFLDQWLTKRKQPQTTPPRAFSRPFSAPAAGAQQTPQQQPPRPIQPSAYQPAPAPTPATAPVQPPVAPPANPPLNNYPVPPHPSFQPPAHPQMPYQAAPAAQPYPPMTTTAAQPFPPPPSVLPPTPPSMPPPPVPPPPAPAPAQPQPQQVPVPANNPSEDQVQPPSKPPSDKQPKRDTVEISGFRDEEEDDTIFIDDEGTLHLRK